MLRRITVIGNLTKDAEVKEVKDRKAINFSVAVNETWTQNGEKLEKSTFFNCVLWRDSNVKVAEFPSKGTKVFLEGTPEPEMFKNKDGEMKCAIKILVSNLLLIGGGSGHKAGETNNSNNTNIQGSGKNDGSDLPF